MEESELKSKLSDWVEAQEDISGVVEALKEEMSSGGIEEGDYYIELGDDAFVVTLEKTGKVFISYKPINPLKD
jgi:hypothetical protein